ncbi:hypothetical protein QJS10_CPB12g00395 [Acorus calamus]|uniref:MADS-box domain-containing protein n=1 Tax=Acorus calamus TaxID=4465 RepID=A0AAV9DMX1_ACOCL|nr:hypothetical protein QJS10_CPB12g00395 [Acorus calamus]
MVKQKEKKEEKKKKRRFQERYESLAKKTREVSVLCGSSYAIIAYSPDGTLHVEGSPSVEEVIEQAYRKGKLLREPKPALPSPDEGVAAVVATKKKKKKGRRTPREKGKLRGPKPEWPSPPDEGARGVGAVVVATKKGKRSSSETEGYLTWEDGKRRVTKEPPWRRVRVDDVASQVVEEEMMAVAAAEEMTRLRLGEEEAEEEMTRLRL